MEFKGIASLLVRIPKLILNGLDQDKQVVKMSRINDKVRYLF